MPAGAAPAYRRGETDRGRWWSCWSWRPNGSAARRCWPRASVRSGRPAP